MSDLIALLTQHDRRRGLRRSGDERRLGESRQAYKSPLKVTGQRYIGPFAWIWLGCINLLLYFMGMVGEGL